MQKYEFFNRVPFKRKGPKMSERTANITAPWVLVALAVLGGAWTIHREFSDLSKDIVMVERRLSLEIAEAKENVASHTATLNAHTDRFTHIDGQLKIIRDELKVIRNTLVK